MSLPVLCILNMFHRTIIKIEGFQDYEESLWTYAPAVIRASKHDGRCTVLPECMFRWIYSTAAKWFYRSTRWRGSRHAINVYSGFHWLDDVITDVDWDLGKRDCFFRYQTFHHPWKKVIFIISKTLLGAEFRWVSCTHHPFFFSKKKYVLM